MIRRGNHNLAVGSDGGPARVEGPPEGLTERRNMLEQIEAEGKLFNGGRLVFTRGVNDLVAENSEFAKQVLDSVKRHLNGDWGDMDSEDKKANDLALKDGSRIFSAYNGIKKIWIITEAEGEESIRSVTTVLFPDEY